MEPIPALDLRTVLPEVIVAATAVVVLMWDVASRDHSRRVLPLLAVAGVALAAFAVITTGTRAPAFGGTYVRDLATVSLQTIALLATGLAVALSVDYLRRRGMERGEYYALMLCACLGAMVMAASADLVVLFLGLETLSLPLYVLAGFGRGDLRSQEAGLKYFLLGSFATAFFLYGVALLYGAAGATTLAAVTQAAAAGLTPLLAGGAALVTMGLAFKAALVPFHAWAPDVYEGAPLPVTAFMAVIAKVGAFAALVRAFTLGMPGLAGQWTVLLAALAVLTMILGNLVAMVQQSMKRLLAYSSIAHAGYLLMGVAAGTPDGVWAMVFYLVVYLFMTLGAFGVVLLLERRAEGASSGNGGAGGEEEGVAGGGRRAGLNEADAIEEYAGLGIRAPWLAAAMTVFMVSLAGLPPTAGFVGKLYLFNAALGAGQVVVALIAALTTVVSAYYYLRVPYLMFTERGDSGVRIIAAPAVRIAIVASAAAVLALGIFPGPLTRAVQPLAALLGK